MKRFLAAQLVLFLLFVLCPLGCGHSQEDEEVGNLTDSSDVSQVENTNPVIVFKTTMGDIRIELNREKAPITVENVMDYVQSEFYDGTIFHRVIPGFVIQGGGFASDMNKKPTSAPIRNEADNGLKNLRGTLSMARTQDIDSATSQFFISLVDNDNLDHKGAANYGYAVFGKVIDGMDVVDAIAATKTTTVGSYRDVPKEAIVVEKVEIVKE